MRRFGLAVFAVLGLLAVPVTAAHADPSAAPTPPVPSDVPGQPVCNVDPALTGLTGLVATADGGYAVVNKANTYTMKVYLLDSKCQRTGSVAYTGNPSGGARDPRDLINPDDFWVADTGDDIQNPSRPTIAMWKLPANGARGTLYRFTYPDGAHSCDAMLLNGGGTPIFVTRVASGPSGIYVPDGQMAPVPAGPVKLKKVGEFTPQDTGTDNKLGPIAQQSVTGGALAPDGKHVALRTLSDAYEWSVTDGDVVKALTSTNPIITPLPSEPDGEAIAYSHDGKSFLTLTSQATGASWSILSYPRAVASSPTTPSAISADGGPGAPKGDTRGWFSKLTVHQLTYLVGGLGLVGLVGLLLRSGLLRLRRTSGTRATLAGTSRTPPTRGGYHGQGGYPQAEYPDGPGYGGGAPQPGAHVYRGDPETGRHEDGGGY
jgi:hypothetical protein